MYKKVLLLVLLSILQIDLLLGIYNQQNPVTVPFTHYLK